MARASQHSFLAAIAASITRIGVQSGDRILVALSGGPDSVAMLRAMLSLRARLGYQLTAAHLNHHIRGGESDRDEHFTAELCREIGIELIVGHASLLDAGGSNLEERARQARIEFLNRAADSAGAAHIALAHHSGDQAETVMLRLLRGAGAAGLGAMASHGPGRIIRPMLRIERPAILDYLDEIGASFVEDSSNRSAAILRNRVRHGLIPEIEREYAPGFSRRMASLATEMRSLNDFVSAAATREIASMRPGELELAQFRRFDEALQFAVLREFLARELGTLRRVTRVHLEQIRKLAIEGPPNAIANLPGGWRAVRVYEVLSVGRAMAQTARAYSVSLSLEGETVVPDAGLRFIAAVRAAGEYAMPRDNYEAIFDLRELTACDDLIVRNYRRGDRVAPLGMNGTRKVKELFVDRKIARTRRNSYPVVTSREGILWVPGLLRCRRALVKGAAETVLTVHAQPIVA
ncbi:MAG TPA: tRNA lysidine(34) synthetase TilS [Candidatus Binataceae bacterium]